MHRVTLTFKKNFKDILQIYSKLQYQGINVPTQTQKFTMLPRYPSREERWDAEAERDGRRESRPPRVEGGGAGGRPTYGSAWEPIPRVHERYPSRR